jgi:RNA polymerase sigma factor (sigma-70 family)
MRSDRDLDRIPENEFHRLSQDELLSLVVASRGSTDPARASRGLAAWKMLIAKDIDRLKGIVETFRHPKVPDVRVAEADVEDVLHSAYERLVKMLGTFRGVEDGEYRGATRTCVYYECLDYCLAEMKRDMARAGSLDEAIEDAEGDGRPRFAAAIAQLEEERVQDEADRKRDAELIERVDAAIQQIEIENRRRAVELAFAGRSTEEAMEELDTSRDNVYQLRRRGLQDLRKILDAYYEEDGHS